MFDLPPVGNVFLGDGKRSAMSARTEGPHQVGQIYLDHGSTTPCDRDVVALMGRVAEHEFANPSSVHRSGRYASRIVEEAREAVATAICALPEEIIFTSGATESNNLAILGVAAAAEETGERRRQLVTTGIEHPSILEPLKHLSKRGFELMLAPVHNDGVIDLNALASMLGDKTLLLSIQAANNEIGTIQPLVAAAEIARKRGALVHCDAAQAFGKIPFDVETANLDFVSISSHKCYGPKGVGALWVNGSPAQTPIAPIQFGGGQERSMRPGTHNTPAIAGFGRAAQIALERLEADISQTSALRDRFEEIMHALVDGIVVNGAREHRLPGASSITFNDVDADAIIARTPELDLSTASACQSGTQSPSHVLRAVGLSTQKAYSTLRVFLGRDSTESSVEVSAQKLANAISSIRQDQGIAPQ